MKRTNNEKIKVLLNNARWVEAKFKIGDFVSHEDKIGVIIGVVVYPNTDYVFAYSMFPTHRGGDIPEDEIEIL